MRSPAISPAPTRWTHFVSSIHSNLWPPTPGLHTSFFLSFFSLQAQRPGRKVSPVPSAILGDGLHLHYLWCWYCSFQPETQRCHLWQGQGHTSCWYILSSVHECICTVANPRHLRLFQRVIYWQLLLGSWSVFPWSLMFIFSRWWLMAVSPHILQNSYKLRNLREGILEFKARGRVLLNSIGK
jgi:hypothetical protein